MVTHCLPALYLNLGTEMIFVLDHRLRVQSDSVEDREKSDKVVKGIILGFLAKGILNEIFKGHGSPTRSGLKMFFEKVAHSSIMRLNENSMDKMFDLMMMAYKYNLQKMTMPEQVMTVTVNHLRALLDLNPLDKEVGAAVEHAYTMAYSFFRPLSPMGWYMLRTSLLTFFQDTHVKVSMFIGTSKQRPDGSFVLFSKEEPVELMLGGRPVGLTQYFAKNGEVTHTSTFDTPYKFKPFEDLPDTLDGEKRSTDLGANLYKQPGSLKIQGGGLGWSDKKVTETADWAMFETLINATSSDSVDDSQLWGMSLFDDEQDEKRYLKESAASNNVVTRIDASKKKKSLKTAMEDLKIDKRPPTAAGAGAEKKKKTKGASVLDLMDEAAARPPTAKPKGNNTSSSPSPARRAPKSRNVSVKRTESSGAPRTRSGSRPATNASQRATSAAAPKRAGSAKRKPAA